MAKSIRSGIESTHENSRHRVAEGLVKKSQWHSQNIGDAATGAAADEKTPLETQKSDTQASLSFESLLHAIKASKDSSTFLNTLQVAYENLAVHGERDASDYHHTVLDYPLIFTRWLFRLSARKKHDIIIIRSIDGIVKTGEMLLVLGRPGAGCSTYLKTLAGELHGIHIAPQSRINYQGIAAYQLWRHFRGDCTYTAENDIHFPELTVDQTLEFAATCRAPRNLVVDDSPSKNKLIRLMSNALISSFNLHGVTKTKLGNEMIRGVSGGERKRVTIAETILGWAPLQCWDNSTRGLDSATAFRFVQVLRLYTDVVGAAAAVSLYQASQAAYDTFDKVAVLYEGRQIYFGSSKMAKVYFTKLGFFCPDTITTADFLTALTHPAEARLLIKEGYESRVPRSAEEFEQLWFTSPERASLLESIGNFHREYPPDSTPLRPKGSIASSLLSTTPYILPLNEQLNLCTKRAFQRLRNNLSTPISAGFGNVVMAIVIGSIFFNLQETTADFFSRSVLIFFAVLMNAFMGAFEVLLIWAQRPIVEKHSRYAFYRPFSDSSASMISDLPNKVISSAFFNIALYFMTNLKRTPAAFFTWLLISFTCFITMSMFFRMIGSSSRSLTATLGPNSIFILNFIIYSGFIVPKAYMHPWLSWIWYINPIAYVYEALMINEFYGRTFACSSFVPEGPDYADVSPAEKQCAVVGAHLGKDYVDGATYLDVAYGFHQAHLWRNFGIVVAMGIAFCCVHLLTSEHILAERSKGQILMFLRSQRPNRHESEERLQATVSGSGTRHSVVTENSAILVSRRLRATSDGVVFHWDSLSYDIKVRKEFRRVLNDVEGWVKPGTLTALMGATGAGKTTLLDVLANRASLGVISGEVLVNGRVRDADAQRKIGYVQQADLHLPTATVREALEFSALLRQPNHISKKEKLAYVDYVVELLQMEHFEHAIVGVEGQGLNIEQRKCLSIGVEMAAKPQLLLFLDEPTSGLDSQTSWFICQLLRKLADNGQAILCTIHQPSAQILETFDRILLLGQGGRTHYFGEVRQMVPYFEGNGAPICGPKTNPADWVLQVTGAGLQNRVDWGRVWQTSRERKLIKGYLTELKANLTISTSKIHQHPASQYAAPFATQLYLVTKRALTDYWRMPTFIWSRFILCVGSAFFLGFSFWNSPASIQGLQNVLFSVFLLLMVFSQIVQQLMPQFAQSRALYEAREGPSRMYDWKVFILCSILVEIPWQTIMAVMAFVTWYFPIGFQHDIPNAHEAHERAGLMCLFVWTFYIFTSTFATTIMAAVEHAEVGVNLAQLFYYLILVFCGILVNSHALPRFWTFMYRVSPLTYLVAGMFATGVAHKNVVCAPTELLHVPIPESRGNQTCDQYLGSYSEMAGGRITNTDATGTCSYCPIDGTDALLESLGTRYEDRWRNFGLIWVYVGFNVVAALGLYWIARVPKRRKGW